MSRNILANYRAWPELPYEKFLSTSHLLHRGVQIIGKLKLLAPFEPEWANVALMITSRGLTTGLIPYQEIAFSIDMDFIDHQVICTTNSGGISSFALNSMSVAQFAKALFNALNLLEIKVTENPKPQEIPNPVPFDQDTAQREYNAELANAWWRILVNTNLVLMQYHARFFGKTQPIGLMWGTFDIRDVRYKDNAIAVPTSGPNAGYLRRNAMDAALIECGFWPGNAIYPKPAFYSFTFPQPEGIEQAKIQPAAARWDKNMYEFVLDYDDLLKTKNPSAELLNFFESTYAAGAKLAGWNPKLIGTGKPI